MTWRLVDSDPIAPARSAAVDEAILIARSEGAVPNTLHLYRRSAPTVSLGHFERVADCVDLAAAERLGVSLVRRMSGGSAVYTDQDQLVYTVAVAKDEVPESPQETFRIFCGGVIEALRALGIESTFKPVNDVLVNERKISGSAQMRRHGVVLQHGTLLVRTDYDRMFAVLRSNKRSRDQLTSLAELLGEVPPMVKVKEAVVQGFSDALGVEFDAGPLSEGEEIEARHLEATKYGLIDHTHLY